MGAGLGAVVAAAQGSSKGTRRVAVVIENKIRVSALACEPEKDFVALPRQGRAYGRFGALAVGPGRRSRDMAFSLEALAKLGIGTPHVFAQRVAAGGFVPLKRMPRLRISNGCSGF